MAHPSSALLSIPTDDSVSLVTSVNAELGTHFARCLACTLEPDKSTPVFLEHHLWGDSYAMTVFNAEGSWSYCFSGSTVTTSVSERGRFICVTGKTRFCNSVLVSSAMPSLLLVFASPRDAPCRCEYPDFCHDVLIRQSMVSVPTETEAKFVYEVGSWRLPHAQVYDKIAPHFSSTRYSQWDGVQHYLDALPANALVLDMGCGNGKYLSHARATGRLCLLGCDRCEELLAICREHGQEVSLVDGLFLPFRSACFDAVISIAVVHHLSTNALRRRFLQQLVRVLRPGGSALITVWAMEKDTSGKKTKSNRGYDKSDVLVGWQLQKQFSEKGEEERYERYYHMFHRGELEWLLGTFPEVRVVQSWYERENWFVVIEKWRVCGTNSAGLLLAVLLLLLETLLLVEPLLLLDHRPVRTTPHPAVVRSQRRVVQQHQHQRHVVPTASLQALVQQRLDRLLHGLVGPLRVSGARRPHEQTVHLGDQLRGLREHVPDAVARKHDVVVALAPLAHQHVRLARHLLLLRRQVSALLVREVAEGARHGQVAVHPAVEDDAARFDDALLLLLLAVTARRSTHVVGLVVAGQRHRLVVRGQHAAGITQVGDDVVSGRDEAGDGRAASFHLRHRKYMGSTVCASNISRSKEIKPFVSTSL